MRTTSSRTLEGKAGRTARRRRERNLAVLVAASLGAVGMLAPGSPLSPASAAEPLREGLVAEYLFEESAGDLAANTADASASPGDPMDAVIRNYADVQRAERGTLQFIGGAKTSVGNWVELPDDLLASAASATISIDVKVDTTMLSTNHFIWNIGSDATQEYWFTTSRGPRSAITEASAAGERNATGYALTANRWHSLTAVLDADADTITLYTDGERSGVGKTTLTPADLQQTLNTIGRSPWPDQLFRGAVGAFRVFDRALADDEVVALSDHDAAAHVTDLAAASNAKLLALDLGDTSSVTSDLDLFTLRGISWESSDPSVVASDGTVRRPAAGTGPAVVTLTARATTRGVPAASPRPFVVTVPALTAAEMAADRDALSLPQTALGNLHLPERGRAGAPITWTSSDPAVISDEQVGEAAPGVVKRPAWGEPDAEVTLTATVGTGAESLTRQFPVTVAASSRPAVDSRYLFAYFTADTLAGEKISLATSQGNSAMSWDVLNGGNPVLSSTEGTRGLRDPFIIRSVEGDRFFMIATDLSIGSGTSWESALDNGSPYLEIWESPDLKNWSAQRHVKVSGPFASMTWAPEAFWDDEAGEYVVYWSSRIFLDATRPYDKTGTPHYTYSKVMYSTTRDFVNFSKAKVWQDAGDRIDSTVIEEDGTFYRFTKEVTGCVDITQESSPSLRALTLTGDFAWQTDASCISKTARGTTRTTEGPTIFKANAGDVSLPAGVAEGYYLFVDDFTGAGYLPLFSESLENPQWRTVAGALPRSRHGSVVPITLNQWESAKGTALTRIATTTTLDVSEGATIEPGEELTARVTASDGGVVAGVVRFQIGESVLEAPVRREGEQFVARAAVPAAAPAGAQIAVTAAFQGYDVLDTSSSAAVEVTVGGTPPLEVTTLVGARCVAGKVVQMVTGSNAEDVRVELTITSPYGTKALAVGAGKSGSTAFSTRLPSIGAGSVSVTATATVNGQPVTAEWQTPYAEARCD